MLVIVLANKENKEDILYDTIRKFKRPMSVPELEDILGFNRGTMHDILKNSPKFELVNIIKNTYYYDVINRNSIIVDGITSNMLKKLKPERYHFVVISPVGDGIVRGAFFNSKTHHLVTIGDKTTRNVFGHSLNRYQTIDGYDANMYLQEKGFCVFENEIKKM